MLNRLVAGHADCVRYLRSFNVPLIILGGGGYTVRNVSRTWAYETAVCVGEDLEVDLPYNEFMDYYGPEFKMDVPATNIENLNEREYLEKIKSAQLPSPATGRVADERDRVQVLDQMRDLPFAPSIAMRSLSGAGPPMYHKRTGDESDSDLDDGRSDGAGGDLDDQPQQAARQRPSRFRQHPLPRRHSPRAASAALSRDENASSVGMNGFGPDGEPGVGAAVSGQPRRKRTFFRNRMFDASSDAVAAALRARANVLGSPGVGSPMSGVVEEDVVMAWDPQVCY